MFYLQDVIACIAFVIKGITFTPMKQKQMPKIEKLLLLAVGVFVVLAIIALAETVNLIANH